MNIDLLFLALGLGLAGVYTLVVSALVFATIKCRVPSRAADNRVKQQQRSRSRSDHF